MSIPINIIGWLTYTLSSNINSVLSDLESGYEAAIVSLSKRELFLVDELQRADLFNEISTLIKDTRKTIGEQSVLKTELKLKKLHDFEVATQRMLSPNGTTYSSNIQWNGTKETLCQIFMQLKKLHTKKNFPYIPNSVEEIALFLKLNFECYKDTDVKTIERVLHQQSGKISDNATHFNIIRSEEI